MTPRYLSVERFAKMAKISLSIILGLISACSNSDNSGQDNNSATQLASDGSDLSAETGTDSSVGRPVRTDHPGQIYGQFSLSAPVSRNSFRCTNPYRSTQSSANCLGQNIIDILLPKIPFTLISNNIAYLSDRLTGPFMLSLVRKLYPGDVEENGKIIPSYRVETPDGYLTFEKDAGNPKIWRPSELGPPNSIQYQLWFTANKKYAVECRIDHSKNTTAFIYEQEGQSNYYYNVKTITERKACTDISPASTPAVRDLEIVRDQNNKAKIIRIESDIDSGNVCTLNYTTIAGVEALKNINCKYGSIEFTNLNSTSFSASYKKPGLAASYKNFLVINMINGENGPTKLIGDVVNKTDSVWETWSYGYDLTTHSLTRIKTPNNDKIHIGYKNTGKGYEVTTRTNSKTLSILLFETGGRVRESTVDGMLTLAQWPGDTDPRKFCPLSITPPFQSPGSGIQMVCDNRGRVTSQIEGGTKMTAGYGANPNGFVDWIKREVDANSMTTTFTYVDEEMTQIQTVYPDGHSVLHEMIRDSSSDTYKVNQKTISVAAIDADLNTTQFDIKNGTNKSQSTWTMNYADHMLTSITDRSGVTQNFSINANGNLSTTGTCGSTAPIPGDFYPKGRSGVNSDGQAFSEFVERDRSAPFFVIKKTQTLGALTSVIKYGFNPACRQSTDKAIRDANLNTKLGTFNWLEIDGTLVYDCEPLDI
jgi:hypothetical protein